MAGQAGVVHEAEVGRAEFGAQGGLAAAGREEGGRARGAAFDAQQGACTTGWIRLQFIITFRFLQGESCLTGQVSFCHAFFAVGAYYFYSESE
jgi:hypothetical protein